MCKCIGTTIEACGIGLDLRENYMLTIDLEGTVIDSCETGIAIEAGSSNNTVKNGTIQNSTGDGVKFDGCNSWPEENRIENMIISNNGGGGVTMLAGFNNEVKDCIITGNNQNSPKIAYGGVVIINGSGAVNYCRISNNGCAGIYADEAAGVAITGNVISGNAEGVRLSFTADTTVMSNTIADNTTAGLIVEPGSHPNVLYNILYGNGYTDFLVLDQYYTVEYDSLKYNDIGTTSLPWLPPSNIPLDPNLNSDLTLKSTSPCIDAIDAEDAPSSGRDIDGISRPQGNTWDMGAFEAPEFIDTDGDGLPDWWEALHIAEEPGADPDLKPDEDLDGDGLTNLEEYFSGSDPNNPISLTVTDVAVAEGDPGEVIPASGVYFTNADNITISGTSINTTSITVNDNIVESNGPWDAEIGLDNGENRINIAADDDNSEIPPVTIIITVVKDSQAPTVTIISPTNQAEYDTALTTINLSGQVKDDTRIASISVSTEQSVALENATWVTENPIPIDVGENPITITVADIFGNTGSATITITREAGVENEEGDQSAGYQQASFLDTDEDGYLDEDEIACGSDPVNDPNSGLPFTPSNFGDTMYPSNHEKEGYFWPDCINPDDDGDRLPDWWEVEHGLDPHNTDSDGDGEPDDSDNDEEPFADAFNNLMEYQNGTDPNIVETVMYNLSLHSDQVSAEDLLPSWLPGYDNVVVVRAQWSGGGTSPESVVFSLKNTSAFPGRAVNDPDPAKMRNDNYDDWYYEANRDIDGSILQVVTDNYNGFDFGLKALIADPLEKSFDQGPIVVADADDGDIDGIYMLYLQSWDFGGRTRIWVTSADNHQQIAFKWVPEGAGTNGIGDAWLYEDPLNELDANADIDEIIFNNPGGYTAPHGDDFNNFEEYRGIIYTPSIGAPMAHMRLNPHRKDLFIRSVGFGGDYPFEIGDALDTSGIDVYDTTDWGHDATEGFEFFTYARTGLIRVSQWSV